MLSRFLVFLFLGLASIQAISVKRVAKTKCPAGFTGELCDVPICNPPGHANFSSNGQSIAFFVHDSITNIQMMHKMKSQMKKIIDQAVKQSPKWLIQFDLLTFDDLSIYPRVSTRNPNEFIQEFDEFVAGNSHNRSSCNDLPVLESIYVYLSTTNLPKNANIYVFMNGIPRINSNLFEVVQDLIVETHAKVYFIQTNAYPCGEPLTNPGSLLMWDIASISGGQVFVIAAKNTAEVMKIIPFHYKSSIIAQQSFADCTEGQSITFPIDSQTKSMSVLINGELANDSPKYFMPDGKLLRYPDNVFTDYSANTRADEFICDENNGFELHEGKCFDAEYDLQTWEGAKDKCSSYNAVLTSTLDKADEEFLKIYANQHPYWTGLNDLENDGQFVWDQGNESSIPLSKNSYTNWAANQPNVDDGNCVFANRDNKWEVTNCSERYFYICVKYPAISPGYWTVNLRTYEGSCSVQVTAQSNIQINVAYTENIHADIGNVSPGNSSNYMIAHVSGPTSLSYTVQDAIFDSPSVDNDFSVSMHPRDSNTCQYNYISDIFNCNSGSYQTLISGTESNGYRFQRILPTLC